MKVKCLIVDKMHESLLPKLEEAGLEAIYRPEITRDQIKTSIHLFDGLIIRSKTFVDQDLLKFGSKLKFVARAGAGVENLDEKYLNSKSISIINAPEGNRDSVGEHTIGLILNLLHNINQGHEQVTNNIWDREGNRGEELGNKTVGIIGYGNMGRTLAKKLKSFGCKVIAYDKYNPNFNNSFAQSVSLSHLMAETEILSLHIPLTDETLDMTGGDFFYRFKKKLIFINTSRGEISSFKSIEDAIISGKIRKAGLDVLENEKLKTLSSDQSRSLAFLIDSGRVIFTPHVAGWTIESYIRINEVLVKKIKTLF